MGDILSQLRQLGVTLGMPENQDFVNERHSSTLDALKITFPNGIVGENEFGSYFINRKIYPMPMMHGCVELNDPLILTDNLLSILGIDSIDKKRVLAMDTETSGLSVASSAFVFMIGMGYFFEDSYIIDQLILPDLGEEKAFLAQIENTFARFDTILTYNGRSFDIPMISSRENFHYFPNSCKDVRHIDFLPLVRKYWGKSLENCRLSTLERDVLEVTRGIEEVPGYLAPEYYREFLSSGDAEKIKGVAYHNQIDVLSLSTFLIYLSNLMQLNLNDTQINDQCGISIQELRKNLLNHNPNDNPEIFCGNTFPVADRKKAAAYLQKHRETEKAIEIYRSLVTEGDVDSCLALSSIYSKSTETTPQAIEYLKKGAEFVESDLCMGIWSKKEKQEKIKTQIEKMERKLRKNHGREK